MDISNAYNLISQKVNLWIKDFIKLLPNIIIAAVILVLGVLLANLIQKLARKFFTKISRNNALIRLFSTLVYVFIVGIAIFSALTILQLDKAVTSILAGAGIIGLALAFAFQDIAANFISGVFISFRRPISVGHIVKVKDYMGKVEEINMRDTKLRTFQGQMVIIPNKDVYQNPIENFSLLGKRRYDITIGVSYGDDLEKVKEITLNTVADLPGLSEDDKTTMFYNEFAGSTINFVLRLWVKSPEQADYLQVGSEAIVRIKKAFDSNNIMLPFPTTTLDFGVKGGTPLKDMPVHISQS